MEYEYATNAGGIEFDLRAPLAAPEDMSPLHCGTAECDITVTSTLSRAAQHELVAQVNDLVRAALRREQEQNGDHAHATP